MLKQNEKRDSRPAPRECGAGADEIMREY